MIFTWFIYIVVEALVQARLIERGHKPIYIVLFIFRYWASMAHGILMEVQPEPWWEYPILVAFQACSFWILFDLILNGLRGLPWNYKGEDSGWLDSLPDKVYWVGKVLALIGAVVFGYISFS